MKLEVGRILITVHVHATEDMDRVMECLEEVMPGKVGFRQTRARGTFKNPIIILEGEVKGDREAFFRSLLEALGEEERERLRRELGDRFSGGTFFIRLDKMAACMGEVRLGEGIQVATSFISYPFDQEGIVSEVRGWL
ncbi:MAG: hypothetical protein GXO65_06485 [Euryarchaeota archaeon]|nr:hypothetical protein [Euryarchaeota archaeon]